MCENCRRLERALNYGAGVAAHLYSSAHPPPSTLGGAWYRICRYSGRWWRNYWLERTKEIGE